MTFGIRFENPGNTLVFDSGALHYRYFSKPSPTAVGSISGGVHTPYRFRVTLPSSSHVPMPAVRPVNGRVVKVRDVVPAGGGDWDIYVWSVTITGSDDQRDAVQVAPELYVFAPMIASSDQFGVRLFRQDGSVSFDSGFKPLMFRQTIAFSASAGGGSNWDTTPLPNQPDMTGFYQGDSSSVPSVAIPVILGSGGYSEANAELVNASEPADRWEYGWSLTSGGALSRRRLWAGTEKPSYTLDLAQSAGSEVAIQWQLAACTALVVEGSGL